MHLKLIKNLKRPIHFYKNLTYCLNWVKDFLIYEYVLSERKML
jgi:hypothetical protein